MKFLVTILVLSMALALALASSLKQEKSTTARHEDPGAQGGDKPKNSAKQGGQTTTEEADETTTEEGSETTTEEGGETTTDQGDETTTEKDDTSCDIKFQLESECSNDKDEPLTQCVNCVLEKIR